MLELPDTEVHLWHIDQNEFKEAGLKENCLPWLGDDELARYKRFVFDRHREQYLLGKVLVRVH